MHRAVGEPDCPSVQCRAGRRRCAPDTRVPPLTGLCRTCREDLAVALGDLPRHHRELFDLALPMTSQRFERVSGSRTAGPVFKEEIAALRGAITGVLACWAGTVTDLVSGPAPERAPGPLAAFLLRHLDVLAAHPAAAEAAEEIGVLAARARRALRPPEAPRVPLGPCASPGCDSTAEATAEPATGRGAVRCASGHVWQAHEWLALRRAPAGAADRPARRPRTLPTKLAAHAAGVSEATVRKWASRGKLTRYGSFSRAEYDVDELVHLASR
uniref:Uncharacterized protein n=1 Tax=Streptomyces sp. 31A4 TaxID=1415543 RepID=U5YS87_9ACTN|nr:hypothetical protein [Streptomyces sp. 31A4]